MFADVNGIRMHYEVCGEGEPVLLIGGFGANAAFWDHATGLLSDWYRVITYDNRGVGETECGAGFSEHDMAEDAVALLDHLGITSAHVLGWSMGSHIGQILGAEHPERLRSLTLVSTYLRRPSRSDYILTSLTGMASRGEVPMEAVAIAVNAFCFPESLFRRMEDEGRRFPTPKRLEEPAGLMMQLAAIGEADTTAVVSDIRVPTLVVHGDRDIMVEPEEGKRVADAIRGSRFLLLEGAGHNILFDLYLDEFRGFLESNAGSHGDDVGA